MTSLSMGGSLNETLSAFYGPSVTQNRLNMSHQAPDILSASTYPGAPTSLGPSKRHPKRKPGQTIYGGYVVDEDEISSPANLSPTHIDGNRSLKKKLKSSPKSDGEDSKKQRGRPRLDTQDETAADRRRTQIRLAQRAYRNRKETTISALKKRVGELERTIEKMNKSFLKFHDNAIGFRSGDIQAKSSSTIESYYRRLCIAGKNCIDKLGSRRRGCQYSRTRGLQQSRFQQ